MDSDEDINLTNFSRVEKKVAIPIEVRRKKGSAKDQLIVIFEKSNKRLVRVRDLFNKINRATSTITNQLHYLKRRSYVQKVDKHY